MQGMSRSRAIQFAAVCNSPGELLPLVLLLKGILFYCSNALLRYPLQPLNVLELLYDAFAEQETLPLEPLGKQVCS